MIELRRAGGVIALAFALGSLAAACTALTQGPPEPYRPPGLSAPISPLELIAPIRNEAELDL